MKRIPVTFLYPVLALKPKDAARAIGVGKTQLWRLRASGQIKATEYGVIPVVELERHLAQEISR